MEVVVELDDSFLVLGGFFVVVGGPAFGPFGFGLVAASSLDEGDERFVNVAAGVSESGEDELAALSRGGALPFEGRGEGCFFAFCRGEALFFLPGAGGCSSSGTSSVPSEFIRLKALFVNRLGNLTPIPVMLPIPEYRLLMGIPHGPGGKNRKNH